MQMFVALLAVVVLIVLSLFGWVWLVLFAFRPHNTINTK
tara:strand:- start:13278 stop:13394 length:117 start_codon:yes stop_codon:yes gene_type:complete